MRNPGARLYTLIDALRGEQRGHFEWIVVDGASNDGTLDVLRRHADLVATLISEPDTGIYAAWNKGVRAARGRWLVFLGVDDLPGPDWFRYCAGAPDVDLVYGNLVLCSPHGQALARVRPPDWPDVARRMEFRMLLPHPGLAHNRRLFERRVFDTSYRIVGDFHFLATAGIRTGVKLDTVQAHMSLGGVSNRPEEVASVYAENLRVLAANNRAMPLSDKLKWAVKLGAARASPKLYEGLQRIQWRLFHPA